MHRWLLKIPFWVRWIFPHYIWRIPSKEKVLYLTFDDGPHPVITPFVLDALKQRGAKATFFCIGKNVAAHPEVFQRIISEGHAVGNHTHNHLNGWKTPAEAYAADAAKAKQYINTTLFRPPYGRITRQQAKSIKDVLGHDVSIVMWTVLSADFDQSISPEQCYQYVSKGAGKGSIVVFHDSEKAAENMRYALPKTLAFFSAKGFTFAALPEAGLKKIGPG